MSHTYRGDSILKYIGKHCEYSDRERSTPLDIRAIRGEVHRFEGLVSRFGTARKATGLIKTVCVSELRHSRSGQRLDPDHWWFRVRAEWMETCLMTGDRVMFTAKVQRCTKGRGSARNDGNTTESDRRQVVGFGTKVRNIVVMERCRRRCRSYPDCAYPPPL